MDELARLRADAPESFAAARASARIPAGDKHKAAAGEQRREHRCQNSKVEFALERLRWLPRQFGDTYVFLNQPAFQVSYVEKGKSPLTMRVVIGKPSAQTYFFVDKIKDVEFNPYWNVPRSIVINEMLPRLYRDPSWLNQKGYEVANDHGRRSPPIRSTGRRLRTIRRASMCGSRRANDNALGRVKIEFPNKHAIYMHDTPERVSSSGTCGVEPRLRAPAEPARNGGGILGTNVDHVDKRIGSKQTDKEIVKRGDSCLSRLLYAWPDAEGKVHFYDDVYDRDAHLKIAFERRKPRGRRSDDERHPRQGAACGYQSAAWPCLRPARAFRKDFAGSGNPLTARPRAGTVSASSRRRRRMPMEGKSRARIKG